MENGMFWSETGSGFGELRSIPRAVDRRLYLCYGVAYPCLHVTGPTEQLRERSSVSCSRRSLSPLRRQRLCCPALGSCALIADASRLIPGLIVANILYNLTESRSKAVSDPLDIVTRKIHPLVFAIPTTEEHITTSYHRISTLGGKNRPLRFLYSELMS